jgi:hypothetical protein
VSIVSDQFVATANQTVFNLSTTPNGVNYIIVSLNGLVQSPNSGYTLSGNVLTLTSNASANEYVEVREISGAAAIGATGPGGYTNLISNTLIGSVANWNPTGLNTNTTAIVLSLPSGNAVISGVNNTAVSLGIPILVYNSDKSNSVAFVNQSANSTTGNQLFTPSSTNYTLVPQGTAKLVLLNTSPIPSWVFA